MQKFDDEATVKVFSALGAFMGQFQWHKDDLELIKEMSSRAKHSTLEIEED